ncbi:MAG: methylamine methyltransferase corrinoid protein reductive activase [Methanosphaera sp.]|uniref:methylamine methyltransferase corrinoid protein reductive activase n=1 Tax=Methanosphaera sp. TaxID=2666342 RepID=UPI0025F7D743|nr:methylamine methyltransferase corrinoid protein reductive activase [Methanosphaera sp.]MCI5867576.1 methylamine methyltransferase corrinoid protein reductive activase [Methanosphaera sp.]MDD6534043.1 methylamine methyltransferase corrinoid protein reductive activase [Methanosphaera sp.]MDY3956147.1 methylamine methyltransferase corrinoid protein reductive activase [Methanosphaera sp.]
MAEEYAIAMDIGTSGIRAQALNVEDNSTIGTTVTLRHPIPGANVMDHLHFAVNVGREEAHQVLIEAVNKVVDQLGVDKSKITRFAVCGNPIQLSLFQNIEIRDLAYWGTNAMERLNIEPPKRNAQIVKPADVDLEINPDAEVYIPPSIKHEIGADALAMLVKSGVVDKEGIYLVSDFGTNAEIALVIDGEIFSCSAAAGPAMEGQAIECGMLASPGAICDIKPDGDNWVNEVLNADLKVDDCDTVDIKTGETVKEAEVDTKATGITGTGVISAYSVGTEQGVISIPTINTPNQKINLQDGIYLSEKDLTEIGKALGAFRAAHITLCVEADIDLEDIDAVYMAGASGFYVDPLKSLAVGQIPACSYDIYQIGNTSLLMARDIVENPELLDELQEVADGMRGNHITLATSEIFEKIYGLELAFCEQNMPLWKYDEWLESYGYGNLPEIEEEPDIHKVFDSDIPDLGVNGLSIIEEVGTKLTATFDECTSCQVCVNECPEKALVIVDKEVTIRSDLCNGSACLRCERICPTKVFDYNKMLYTEGIDASTL